LRPERAVRGGTSSHAEQPRLTASIELMDARQFDTVQGLPGTSQRTPDDVVGGDIGTDDDRRT